MKNGSAVELARTYPGEHLLLDASVPGVPGGTGRTFDWAIASEVARERKLTLAGGLLRFACLLGLRRLHAGPGTRIEAIAADVRAGLAGELAALIEEHRRLWLRRCRRGGLEHSAAWLERVARLLD